MHMGHKFIHKKGRYWPKGVHGDAINEYFMLENNGDLGYLSD